MTLPDDEEDTFERFVGWLYTKNYIVDEDSVEDDEGFWSDIIDDHVFADKTQVPGFGKAIINIALGRFKLGVVGPMNLSSVMRIYTEAPKASSLRRLALAMYECRKPSWFQEAHVGAEMAMVPEFAIELLKRFAGSGRQARKRRTLKADEFGDQGSNIETL